MSAPPRLFTIGPVRLGLLPHAGGRGETAARAWLAGHLGVAPAAVPLRRDVHGRPCLEAHGQDCNWSHSGDRLLVALGEGVRVGVDLELARPRPKALEIARRYFHADEAAALARLAPDARDAAFLRLWCAKEAVLKAHGRGLAHGLDRFAVRGFDDADEPLRLRSVDPGLAPLEAWSLADVPVPGAIAVLAWRPDPD